MLGDQALIKFVVLPGVSTVLDIGCGTQEQANVMRASGKRVMCISLTQPADVFGDYLDLEFDSQFDGIWASHVLEHMPNPGHFLSKCFDDLRDDGWLAVTVPPAKHELVGGHLTLWNEGILLYNLILAGFDCSEALVGVYDYNISVIVRKRPTQNQKLVMDAGDIERLAQYFPVPVWQGVDGRFGNVNWN